MSGFRYKDGTKVAGNTRAAELRLEGQKDPKKLKELDKHMKKLDDAWRDAEGRTPAKDLTEREKILEGRLPWNPVRLKELSNDQDSGLNE